MTQNCTHLLDQLAKDIQADIDTDAVMVGIRTGGVWVAQALNNRLEKPLPLGELNISFYRDDFTRIGLHPNVAASDIAFDIEGKTVILVDDVLYSGRTIKAALNELFDFGRPAKVLLAVLVQRDGQELPIQANYVGQQMQLSDAQYITIRGPEPITYEIRE